MLTVSASSTFEPVSGPVDSVDKNLTFPDMASVLVKRRWKRVSQKSKEHFLKKSSIIAPPSKKDKRNAPKNEYLVQINDPQNG